jgi:hypothetical protein
VRRDNLVGADEAAVCQCKIADHLIIVAEIERIHGQIATYVRSGASL